MVVRHQRGLVSPKWLERFIGLSHLFYLYFSNYRAARTCQVGSPYRVAYDRTYAGYNLGLGQGLLHRTYIVQCQGAYLWYMDKSSWNHHNWICSIAEYPCVEESFLRFFFWVGVVRGDELRAVIMVSKNMFYSTSFPGGSYVP